MGYFLPTTDDASATVPENLLPPDGKGKFSGHRYYNPSIGRWASRDPIGELGYSTLKRASRFLTLTDIHLQANIRSVVPLVLQLFDDLRALDATDALERMEGLLYPLCLRNTNSWLETRITVRRDIYLFCSNKPSNCVDRNGESYLSTALIISLIAIYGAAWVYENVIKPWIEAQEAKKKKQEKESKCPAPTTSIESPPEMPPDKYEVPEEDYGEDAPSPASAAAGL